MNKKSEMFKEEECAIKDYTQKMTKAEKEEWSPMENETHTGWNHPIHGDVVRRKDSLKLGYHSIHPMSSPEKKFHPTAAQAKKHLENMSKEIESAGHFEKPEMHKAEKEAIKEYMAKVSSNREPSVPKGVGASVSNQKHQKGVHYDTGVSDSSYTEGGYKPDRIKGGISNAGMAIRYGNKSIGSKEDAKAYHSEKLAELKAMPKPKLSKSESNMHKAEECSIKEYAQKMTKAEEKATFEYHRQQAADHEATAKHYWDRYEDDSKSSDHEISRNSREHRNVAMFHEGKAEQHLNSAKGLHNAKKHGPWNSTIPKGNVIKE